MTKSLILESLKMVSCMALEEFNSKMEIYIEDIFVMGVCKGLDYTFIRNLALGNLPTLGIIILVKSLRKEI